MSSIVRAVADIHHPESEIKVLPKIAALAAATLVLLVSGCADIVPGLNVRLGGGAGGKYKVVNADGDRGYKVESVSDQSYQIVPIDAAVLEGIYREKQFDKSAGLPSLLPTDLVPEYRIGPSDIVYVTVWDHPELTTPYAQTTSDNSVPALQGRLVAADGTMYYPYVGVLNVAGKTTAAVRGELIHGLTRVIADPQVDVRVVAFRSKRIEVTGEVARPGTVTLDDSPKGLLQAIAAAGGLTLNASRRRAVLTRNGQQYPIDLAHLLAGTGELSNPVIMAGDVINIPDQSGDSIYVLGAVNRQQPYPILQDSMPLIRALTEAGGLDNARANQTGVLVFRLKEKNSKELSATVFTLDLSKPDGVLLASQFPLEPRDVVYVQTGALAQYNLAISNLLPTVTTIYTLQLLRNANK